MSLYISEFMLPSWGNCNFLWDWQFSLIHINIYVFIAVLCYKTGNNCLFSRTLGASQNTIELEVRKLEELKGIIFNEFRREVLSRIKKQGERVCHATGFQLLWNYIVMFVFVVFVILSVIQKSQVFWVIILEFWSKIKFILFKFFVY